MTAQPPTSSTFLQACVSHATYPLNLDFDGIEYTQGNLEAYKKRLDVLQNALCLESEEYVEVPIRDFHGSSAKDPSKCSIHSSKKLLAWLGVSLHPPEADKLQICGTGFEKQDPKCRFIYIYAEHSRQELRLTREILTCILSFHQVMPAYLDHMFVFGAQSDLKEINYSGFRSQMTLRPSSSKTFPPELQRSGKHFQLCYNLKGVTLKHEHIDNIALNEWSVRQAAVHHQFDVVQGTMLWLVTKGRLDIQQRFKYLTGPNRKLDCNAFDDRQKCFQSSLVIHLMMCRWCTEDWRWYISWLEAVFQKQTDGVIYGPHGLNHAQQQYQPSQVQELQALKDMTNQAVAHLQSNIDIMTALQRFYASLSVYEDFPSSLLTGAAKDLKIFGMNVEEIVGGFRMCLTRLNLLELSMRERRDLMSQHIQIQAVQRAEQLNVSFKKDAIRMRVITIVTLVFLPATFVSTFFGTDIVRYEHPDRAQTTQESLSPLALQRWFEITIPLTIVTVIIAWVMSRQAEHTRQSGSETRMPERLATVGSKFRQITSRSSQRQDPSLP